MLKIHTPLATLPPAKRYFIGYSGGRDSHVLLDLLCQMRGRDSLHGELIAIHIDHNLNPKSKDWANHCQTICRDYDTELIIETVSKKPKIGESLEAFAREARYGLIEKHLDEGDIFLSAHHQRDQAETFLLQLMRGAGLDGLRAMPVERKLGEGRYFRPLLHVNYNDIVHHAKSRLLSFIHDDSNDNLRFDRNFLRHEILPLLETRFPKASASIAQSAQWLGELPSPAPPEKLIISELKSRPVNTQKQQIRDFIKAKTGQALSQTQTQYILTHHLCANADKHPTLKSRDFIIRRHDGKICVTAELPKEKNEKVATFPKTLKVGETFNNEVATLYWENGCGLETQEILTIAPLKGRDRFHPHTRHRATTVKKCFNEAKIPEWLRQFYFGIYLYNELIAIPNVGISKNYYRKGKNARLPTWQIATKFVTM